MPNKMAIILVEDNAVVRDDIKSALLTRYAHEINVHELGDWPEARSELPRLLGRSHLILSDMNLKDNAVVDPSDKYLRTEFDGLRVFGMSKKINASVPVILYTAHELAQHALDQCDDPTGPLWVVRKSGEAEISACVERLAAVAEGLIWRAPLEVRWKVYEALAGGDANELDGDIAEGGPSWRSILTVIYAVKDASATEMFDYRMWKPKVLSEVLAKFLPTRAFKVPFFCRLIKPADYHWPDKSETFGIAPPAHRVDEQRSAWEQLVHLPEPAYFKEYSNKDRWRRAWRESVEVAEGELASSRFAMLESTVDLFRDCLKGARELLKVSEMNDSRFEEECRRYTNGPVKKINDGMRGSWSKALHSISGKQVRPSDLVGFPYCAEWGQMVRGVQYVCESSLKHAGAYTMGAEVTPYKGGELWRLRISVADRGEGIDEFTMARAFVSPSEITPTENMPVNHKLQSAQGRLWGYCDWLVLSKCRDEPAVRYYNVYGGGRDAHEAQLDVGGLAHELERQGSGTVHVLDFICPAPKPDYRIEVKHETVDLR